VPFADAWIAATTVPVAVVAVAAVSVMDDGYGLSPVLIDVEVHVTSLPGRERLTGQLDDGRTLEYAGDEDDYADWLGELGTAETVVSLDVHEMTDDELDAYGPIMDSPGTSPEDDF
jgi:hypothetical protein